MKLHGVHGLCSLPEGTCIGIYDIFAAALSNSQSEIWIKTEISEGSYVEHNL